MFIEEFDVGLILFQEKSQQNPYRIDRFSYAFPWLKLMLSKTFGIMGHKSMEKTTHSTKVQKEPTNSIKYNKWQLLNPLGNKWYAIL